MSELTKAMLQHDLITGGVAIVVGILLAILRAIGERKK